MGEDMVKEHSHIPTGTAILVGGNMELNVEMAHTIMQKAG